ncbi:HEAT repeat domain-containing protein [Pedobacter changchengzhani]|uniref:HEAT repeat domain-containing protein n=1 Tax=Pedobacter changchengzhani TaxID=2529274 RepID=A0A4R5MLK8_9SPHI|nr:HEAT repeat domain-containing protein [Pedobacter changchengzhani]TDG36600.1 HEAT repeat domain-containing protein [Pedobacter changchengzhani]
MSYLQYYSSYFISEFSTYPFIIQLTALLVLTMLSILLISMVRLIFINRKIFKFSKAKQKVSKLLYSKIENLIFGDENLTAENFNLIFAGDLNEIKTPQRKKALTEILLEMLYAKKTNKVLNTDNYLLVLNIFGIIAFWEKLVVSNNATNRKTSMRILDDLQIGLSGSSIQRSVYQKNDDLRKLARATSMEYDSNDPFKFLEDSFDSNFNSLDEIRVHYFLSNKSKEEKLPQLIRWVKSSTNAKFRAFIIKEIGYFNQMESAPLLVELLDDEKNQKVLCSIIEALGKLNYTQAEEKLISLYEVGSKPIQRSAIKAFSEFKTINSLNVLEKSYFKTHDNDMKLLLAYAISEFGISGKSSLKKLSKTSTDFDKKIFDQVNYQF